MGDSLKRKFKTRTIHEKYKTLKVIHSGSSYASMVKNYNFPKWTLAHWVNYKKKIYATVESNSSTKKRQQMRQSPYELADKACHTWLIYARHRNISILVSAAVLKTEALYFTKEFSYKEFQASDGWLDRWIKRYTISFKTVSGIYFQ